MKTRATGRESDQFLLRLPEGVRSRLQERARENMRSVTAEINVILAKALRSDQKVA